MVSSNKKGPVATGPKEKINMDESTTIAAPEQALVPLSTLAEQANAEHREVVSALNSGLEHARRAGELLTEAKRQCPHGTWQQWVAENFEGSHWTARAYMRVSERWPELEAEAKRRCVNVLSYSGALKLLTAPEEPDESDQPKSGWKPFLKQPKEIIQETCRDYWDVMACHVLLLHAAGRTSPEIAEALGVEVREVECVVYPRPAKRSHQSFVELFDQCGVQVPEGFESLYEEAVAESIARRLVMMCQLAQHAAEKNGYRHVVPILGAMERQHKRIAERLEWSDCRMMQIMEGIAPRGSVGEVWAIAVGVCVINDMRTALGIDPEYAIPKTLAEAFSRQREVAEKLQAEGKLAA